MKYKMIKCISACLILLSGCANNQSIDTDTARKNEQQYTEKEKVQKFIPQNSFIKYFTESYGEYNDFAKEIYSGLNQKNTDQFSTAFNSREEADQFVIEFNSKTFLDVDYAYENGIILNDFQSDGKATFTILPSTYKNIELYDQFIKLAEELSGVSGNKVEYVQNINQWICDNVEYDHSNYSNNLSTDIFSGYSKAEGVSNAVKILCNLFGIGCSIETGSVNGSPSSWNIIYIEGNSYYLDCTLNIYYQDPNLYFLSDKIWEDHTILKS